MSSSIIIGKITAFLLKIFSLSGGTALPGLITLKLNPALINQIAKKNSLRSIIITGTNGKTTTSRLLGAILKIHNISYIHNRSGSNLIRGIASTLINQSNIFGQLKTKLAIWEIDEAAVTQAIQQLHPEIILFNNLSRDQLDRYGEIDSILKSWQESLNLLPKKSQVIINQSDSRLIKLHYPQTVYFGAKLSPGQYHLSNILAAKTIAKNLKLNRRLTEKAIKSFQPAFGRGETFKINKKLVKILLVKNPAGFNAVLNLLQDKHQLNNPLMIVLNDLIADGTDVSWIWDINFQLLELRQNPVIISGLRVDDLALRLKYANVNQQLIIVKPNLKQAWLSLISQPGKIINILPTYTAMLQLRQFLSKQKIIHPTWQD